MRFYLLIILCSIFISQLSAQPSINWEKSLGGSQDEFGYCIAQTFDGGYIVAGSSSSNDGNVAGNHSIYSDFWIVKLDNAGGIAWQKCFGGTSNEGASSIIQTSDSGYAVAGYTTSSDGDVTGNHGGEDYWVLKITNAGIIQWKKCYGGSLDDYAYKIIQTTDGGFAIIGNTYSSDGDVSGNHGGGDCWMVKTDSAGTVQWQKCYGGTRLDDGTDIIQTTDGGYAITGFSNSSDGDVTGWHQGFDVDASTFTYDCWVIKTNDTVAIQWEKCYGGTWYDNGNSIIQTPDGGFLVAGETGSIDGDVTGNHGNSNDYWVLKLDNSGVLQWEKCYGGSLGDWANSIVPDGSGGFVIAGAINSSDGDITGFHGDVDNWIVCIDASGNIKWQECLGGTNGEEANSIIKTTDNGYAVCGWSKSNDDEVTGNHGLWDYWIVKLNPFTGIDEVTDNALSVSIYPDPFTESATLTIKARLDEVHNSNYYLYIYNVLGERVRKIYLHNADKVIIERGELPGGMYFYRLENSNAASLTGKFIIR